MDFNDDSSSNPCLKPGFQTPGANKRLRAADDNTTESQTRIIYQENLISNNKISHNQRQSIQQNDFPPITIEFKSMNNNNDRKLIQELIKEWETKNTKKLDVIGRYGFKNVLLIFARNITTLDELLDKDKWPTTINGAEYTIKFPKILPEAYSIVIKDFQITWNETEVTDDLREKYSSLIKLTRFVTRDGRSMNIVRADFNSSKQANYFIKQGEIDINYMKLYVRPYFAPIKVNKCRKCFKHDHFTSQCTSPPVCFRCGQQHSLEGGCNNDIKCANCEQQHFPGHPACPVVQQRRKQIAEQQKVNQAQLLIKQQQYQTRYNHDPNTFPHLMNNSNKAATNMCLNATISPSRTTTNQSYSAIAKSRSSGGNENIEQLMMALSSSINQQLSSFIASISIQITEVTKKMNANNDKLLNIENQIQESIIPAIIELSKIVDNISEHKDKIKAFQSIQTSSYTEFIQQFFKNDQPAKHQNTKFNQNRQVRNLTHTFLDQTNRTQ
ncbi:unnamed protein product [Adineta steineri]|uniref:Gag-like protein n=2 Tax=Adineta steineri TaxID=433720 RepID=A0A819QMB2_9BILA|nr:unnamed protein product [Adineta steineri]